MHDERVRLEAWPLFGEAEERRVFAEAREISLRCRSCWMRSRFITSASAITASRSWVTGRPGAQRPRDERGRAAERDARAEFDQRVDIRARDAAEKNVAEDRDVQPGDSALFFANGEGVEQRLRGMLVRAVAGVDDAGVEPLGEEIRRAAGAVPQHDDVGEERLEVQRGVLERLAFGEARMLAGN